MAKGKFQGTSGADDWSPILHALRLAFPEGVDALFRCESDADDDFMAAYERAVEFKVALGQTRVAYLWQQALKIGFRAGHGGAPENVRICEASEDYTLGREVGLKEGRTSGLRDGKQDGRKAGKIQGLKEGREFSEKQAAKLNKTPTPDRVLVDVGTDSPVVELSPCPSLSSKSVHASTQTDTPPAPIISSTRPKPPLSWADPSYRIYSPLNPTPCPTSPSAPDRFDWAAEADATEPPPLPPRDFSALRSNTSSLTPFSTL
ncbi:hypothetical protein B0H13DRAFT_2318909 [Mycena leptocephala]|nr:hypothetical protein B0H13DRAFT_2318909 [Mycena leptocephala]